MAEADEHTVVPDFMMQFSSSSHGRFFCDCCVPTPAPLPCYLKVLILKVKEPKEYKSMVKFFFFFNL